MRIAYDLKYHCIPQGKRSYLNLHIYIYNVYKQGMQLQHGRYTQCPYKKSLFTVSHFWGYNHPVFVDATYNLKPYPKFLQKIEMQFCNIPNWHFDLNILKKSHFTYHVTKSPKGAVSLDGKWFPKSYTVSKYIDRSFHLICYVKILILQKVWLWCKETCFSFW